MNKTNYKKWTIELLLVSGGLILIFFAFNILFDFYGYFNIKDQKEIIFTKNARDVKLKHISINLNEYDGFIIGGSKSGALDPDLISEYEGMKFYNLCVPQGCFRDYKEYIAYLVGNTSVKKIILHLSSVETLNYEQAYLPAIITKSKIDVIKTHIKFLLVNPMQVFNDMKQEVYTYPNGSLNYEKIEKRILEDKNYIREDEMLGLFTDSDEYMLWRTFYYDKEIPAFDENIQALSEIVNICNSNDVELQVIIGPTYLYELYEYEGDRYWSYLRQIASLTTFWDFSGFLDENRNPYNFINTLHYNRRVGAEMINIIYGKKQRENFGVYVTPDTFNEYIEGRMSKFFEMKKEFDENGTIPLIDNIKDASFIN